MMPQDIPPEVLKEILDKRRPKGIAHISDLEGPNGLSLLLYLDENSPVMKSDIYRDVSKSETMTRRMDRMRELGLIDIRYTGYLNAYAVSLTVKGKAVVRRIRGLLEVSEV